MLGQDGALCGAKGRAASLLTPACRGHVCRFVCVRAVCACVCVSMCVCVCLCVCTCVCMCVWRGGKGGNCAAPRGFSANAGLQRVLACLCICVLVYLRVHISMCVQVGTPCGAKGHAASLLMLACSGCVCVLVFMPGSTFMQYWTTAPKQVHLHVPKLKDTN